MSKKISELEDGDSLLPNDLIPIARVLETDPQLFENFHVSADKILLNRRFCHLSSSVTLNIPYNSRVPLKLNSFLGGENSWYDISNAGQKFKPLEAGVYRLTGDFLFYITSSGTDLNPKGFFEISVNQFGAYRKAFFDLYSSPTGSDGTGICYKFIFSETIQINQNNLNNEFEFFINNPTNYQFNIRAGTYEYNYWSLIIEKIY